MHTLITLTHSLKFFIGMLLLGNINCARKIFIFRMTHEIGIDIANDDLKTFVEFLQDGFRCNLSVHDVFGPKFETTKRTESFKQENFISDEEEDDYDEDYNDNNYKVTNDDEVKPIKCKECGRLCKNLTSYKKHMTIMHSEEDQENKKPVRCEECNKLLKSKSSYLRHWSIIHKPKEEPFQCDECDFKTAYEYKLKHHINKEHKSKNEKHTCTCGKSFSTKKHLGRHVREVHNGETLNCDQCSYQTKRARDLRKHVEQRHGDGEAVRQERPDIFCEFCGFSCKYQQSLQDHMERFHLQNEYKCDKEGCDFVTRQKRKLQEHKTRHGEELICPTCGKIFTSNKAWLKHKRETHKPQIERKCEFCEYTTISLKMYTKHLKWRHSEFSDKRYANSKGFDWAGNREKWRTWKHLENEKKDKI